MYKGAQNSTNAVERELSAMDWPGKASQNHTPAQVVYFHAMSGLE